MPNDCILRATSWPMRPSPTIPRVLPYTSFPMSFFLSQRPARRDSVPAEMCLKVRGVSVALENLTISSCVLVQILHTPTKIGWSNKNDLWTKWTVLSGQLVWQRGESITNINWGYPCSGPVSMRWRTRHGITDRRTDGRTDNMQFLVWPVHRTFARQ